MNLFDMRTIVLTGMVTEIISTVVIVALWLQNRKRFPGMALLATGFALQTAGWLLIIPRGFIPDFVSMVVSNTLVVAGAFSGYAGLARFTGERSRHVFNWLLFAIFPFIHSYYLFIDPSLTARSMNTSIVLAIFFFQYTWLLLYRASPDIRPFTKWVGIFYGLSFLTSCARIVQLIIAPARSADYLRSGGADALAMLTFQVLLMLLTYSLALMVNKRLLANIQHEEEKFSKAFHSSPYAIFLARLSDRKIFEVNNGFSRITGYQPSEVFEKSTLDLHFWNREEERTSIIEELTRRGGIQEREASFRKKSGEVFIGLYSAEIITIHGEKCVLASIDDITERKRAEEQIRHLANHDALTDLPSMRLAQDRFSMAVSLVRRNKTRMAVMFIDLDGFKAVNDTFGHDAGDHVLRQIAVRLLACVRETDTVARVGGDEFILIVPEIHMPENAAQIAGKIINILSRPIDFNGQQTAIGASIGIALCPGDGETLDDLMKQADDAMYRAKKAGKNSFCFSTGSAKDIPNPA